MIVLGLDTGLRAFGWAVADYTTAHELAWLDAGVWATKPGAASRRGDDTGARVVHLYRNLRALAALWKPQVITVEALAFPAGRVRWSTISQLARARCLADCIAVEHRCSLYERTPQELKRAVTGSRSASKAEVITGMGDRHPRLRELLAKVPVARVEHAADAAASIHASLDALERMVNAWDL